AARHALDAGERGEPRIGPVLERAVAELALIVLAPAARRAVRAGRAGEAAAGRDPRRARQAGHELRHALRDPPAVPELAAAVVAGAPDRAVAAPHAGVVVARREPRAAVELRAHRRVPIALRAVAELALPVGAPAPHA